MNLSMKQKQTHRNKGQTYGFQVAGGVEEGVQDQQMQTIMPRMDKQQGPTVKHRELYSISNNRPSWKRI